MRRPSFDRSMLQRLLIAWVVLLLALPALLWVAGKRQPLLESRAKVAFPPLDRHTLADPATFTQIDTALRDRLPARGRALDLHAGIAMDLFHDSPSPDVAIGKDGFLFYVPELGQCRPGGGLDVDAADMADVMTRSFAAAGVRPVVTFTDSKLFVQRAQAPSIDAGAERCEAEVERRVDERLQRAPGGLSLAPRLRAEAEAGRPVFLRKDTHWNWRGRELFAREVLDRVRPGLADEAGLTVGGDVRRDGDLLRMVGRPGGETDRALDVLRTPLDPLAPGSVVLIGDSQLHGVFATAATPDRQPIATVALPGQTVCDWPTLEAGGCDEALRAARTVVLQKVARDLGYVARQCWRPLTLMGERLRGGAPSRWERVDGGRLAPGGRLAIGDDGSVRVRVRSAGADVSSTPRLLRLPLLHDPLGADGAPVPVALTQEPQAGPPAPCATPSQIGDGGALFLPVPAGRRASDLVVRLTGAPGTVLARPQEIVLDGRAVRGAGR